MKYFTYINFFLNHCSSNADDDEIDPSNKAVREKERRQANNVRERYVENTNNVVLFTQPVFQLYSNPQNQTEKNMLNFLPYFHNK